jgi:hypothetical protein
LADGQVDRTLDFIGGIDPDYLFFDAANLVQGPIHTAVFHLISSLPTHYNSGGLNGFINWHHR